VKGKIVRKKVPVAMKRKIYQERVNAASKELEKNPCDIFLIPRKNAAFRGKTAYIYQGKKNSRISRGDRDARQST
jgi:hypothetical protein